MEKCLILRDRGAFTSIFPRSIICLLIERLWLPPREDSTICRGVRRLLSILIVNRTSLELALRASRIFHR